jgi:spore germination protein
VRQWKRCLVVILCLFTFTGSAWGIELVVNDEKVETEVPPVLVEGRVLVPLRSVMEKLGASVTWQPEQGIVVVSHPRAVIQLQPGEPAGRINGVDYPLDVPPRLLEERIMIPLRFVSEALGAEVHWLPAERQVSIRAGSRIFPGEIWGYYIDAQSLVSLQEQQERVRGVYFNSYTLQANGEVEERVFFPQGLELCRSQGISSQAMVFSDSREAINQVLGNKEAWQITLSSLLEWLEQRGYTGVHLDLENVGGTSRELLTDFVAFVHGGLKKQGYSLSLALPAKTADQMGWFDAYDYQALGAIADQVVLMAYDEHYPGGDPGPIAGLDWVEKVVGYAVQVIPAEKIMLGLGIYGYDWPERRTGRTVDLSQVSAIMQSFPGEKIFDDTKTYSSAFRYRDGDGVWREIWYESPQSLKGKLELARKYQLRGITLWRLGIIPPEIWQAIGD